VVVAKALSDLIVQGALSQANLSGGHGIFGPRAHAGNTRIATFLDRIGGYQKSATRIDNQNCPTNSICVLGNGTLP
jgi:hypothetical protein